VIVLSDMLHHLPEARNHALRPRFLEQRLNGYRPGALPPAMLAGQFIDTAFERFAKTEIIRMECEHFFALYGIEDPIGEFDFDPLKATVETMLPADRCGVD
jgi:hypothetical protein